ncbi:MAG: hypothetical protein K0S07_855 [Chlamydiales bacterium]|jgi:hypothetical protein|nr:hypothetical protein [Chlamydiales bacterium]
MSYDSKYHILPTTIVTNGTPLQMEANAIYIADHTSAVMLILPYASITPIGTIIQVCGVGNGGWRIDQSGAGQTMRLASQVTTSFGGYITSTNPSDCVTLVSAGDSGYGWVISNYTGTINIF